MNAASKARPHAADPFPHRSDLLTYRELMLLCPKATPRDREIALAARLDMPRPQVRAIVTALIAGEKMRGVARIHNLTYPTVMFISACTGRRRKPHANPRSKTQRTCGALTWSQVEALRRTDTRPVEIAALAGVTRERVRIVLRELDAAPARERDRAQRQLELQRQHDAAAADRQQRQQLRLEAKNARLAALALRLASANALWKSGATYRAIADAYQVATTMIAWEIHCARRTLGPDWFPLRRRG